MYPAAGAPLRLTPDQAGPYAAQIAYFVDCALTGRPADRATPAAARLALRVALAARSSLEQGGETVPVRG